MNAEQVTLKLSPEQLDALAAMAARGWSQGDMAKYLEAHQIPVYLEVLTQLGLDALGAPLPAKG